MKSLTQPTFNIREHYFVDNSISYVNHDSEGMVHSLTAYVTENITRSVEVQVRQDKKVVQFWVHRLEAHPDLALVALLILATFPFSAVSEREFSLLQRVVSSERASLKYSTIEEIIVAKSALVNGM